MTSINVALGTCDDEAAERAQSLVERKSGHAGARGVPLRRNCARGQTPSERTKCEKNTRTCTQYNILEILRNSNIFLY